MKEFFKSRKAISTITGAALGVIYVIACHFDKELIQLEGLAMFVIGLFASHVVGQSFVDHREMSNRASVPPGETK